VVAKEQWEVFSLGATVPAKQLSKRTTEELRQLDERFFAVESVVVVVWAALLMDECYIGFGHKKNRATR